MAAGGFECGRRSKRLLHPTTVLAYLHSFYSRNSDWRKDAGVLKSMVEALSTKPGGSPTRLCIYSRLLGEALFKSKDYPAAEAAFRSLTSLPFESEGNRSCQSNVEKLTLAQILDREGKKDEAGQGIHLKGRH